VFRQQLGLQRPKRLNLSRISAPDLRGVITIQPLSIVMIFGTGMKREKGFEAIKKAA
jgi:hypothetical protein